ncbi:hypothetical protein A2U01_0083520, partial [Trifolium medium]|nr:hypothetical protein [Trifolium medium]
VATSGGTSKKEYRKKEGSSVCSTCTIG